MRTFLCGVLIACVQSSDAAEPSADASGSAGNAAVARGKYLVHHVAMCVQCHTPRNDQGELIHARLLQGSPVTVRPPYENQPWAFEAPKIAGLPAGWSEQELVQFLTTGDPPRPPAPDPPMPPFRLSKADAVAVVAYLRALGDMSVTRPPLPRSQ